MAVVICPATYDRVQGFDKCILSPGARILPHFPDPICDRFYRLPGWLNEQFPFVLPEIIAPKVESVIDMGDHCLFPEFEAAGDGPEMTDRDVGSSDEVSRGGHNRGFF